jgi:Protein of unknown function (DUF3303)
MLFVITYKVRETITEEKERRNIKEFASYTPPTGIEIKSHYHAPGLIGFVTCEAANSAALIEYILAFTPYFEHEIYPVVEIKEAMPIIKRVYAWQDSVR